MEKKGGAGKLRRESGDRKGKKNRPIRPKKQRAGVKENGGREKEEGVGGGGSLGKRYKNREKWRNAEGERGRSGRRIKGSGRGRRCARKTRSRAGQKE